MAQRRWGSWCAHATHTKLMRARVPSALRSPFFAGSPRVSALLRFQGFGKRSGAIGMPRPKKAKVLPKEVSRMESLPAASAEITSSEGDSVSPSLMAEAPSATSFEVVDKAMLKDAATVTKMARASVKEAAVDVRCLLYTSPSPRDIGPSRMPSSA